MKEELLCQFLIPAAVLVATTLTTQAVELHIAAEGQDANRGTQAAPGERVEIRGSEVVTNWVKVQDDVWKVTLPNAFFGRFNPYSDRIRGDWFDPRGREHHTGAVYLNGDWLTEATRLEEVLLPAGSKPAWLSQAEPQYLLNLAWLRPGSDAERVKPQNMRAVTPPSTTTTLPVM